MTVTIPIINIVGMIIRTPAVHLSNVLKKSFIITFLSIGFSLRNMFYPRKKKKKYSTTFVMLYWFDDYIEMLFAGFE